MYGPEVAPIHDDLYVLRGKDYPAEAEYVTKVVRERAPHARSLLDVGCGTGAHLVTFAGLFDHVVGLDLSESMLAVAGGKLPGVPLHRGDMRSFDLGRRFDAVVCLFASIAHCASVAELTGALRCFARHVAAGGVVVVEPRWFRENFLDGHVAADVVEAGGTTISRVSHTARDGDMWDMDVHFLVADPKSGVRHVSERYRHRLFTRAEYEGAFAAAGLDATYTEGVQGGRGIFTAVPAKGSGH
ncbi:class I SAM-dependent DNA methyltransferase [Saccharothrix syringae]|uniref:Class I SAM-dependent methyltransferase n=1 Tax=Saccharothrix syringae TaxID=103733 RepID=A0A5Q0H6G1_SACSY|nr:class I SAM-dependent methyltransferase [Saccharothrix syringae]QFZ21440.1 class I SAM-dependent methyltransferase [Saccharothrix syringae]